MARGLGFEVISGYALPDFTPVQLAERVKARVGGRPVFLTFDADFVDPAFAPGTGTPEVGGPSSREALAYLRALVGLNLVGMDIVEVLPAYDHAEVTALLAATAVLATAVFELMTLLALNRRERSKP